MKVIMLVFSWLYCIIIPTFAITATIPCVQVLSSNESLSIHPKQVKEICESMTIVDLHSFQ